MEIVALSLRTKGGDDASTRRKMPSNARDICLGFIGVDGNPLDSVPRDLLVAAVVKLSPSGIGMASQLLHVIKRNA